MVKDMIKRYFVEVYKVNSGELIIQTQWFDTLEEAIGWEKTLDTLDREYNTSILESEYNEETDEYGDVIETLRKTDIKIVE